MESTGSKLFPETVFEKIMNSWKDLTNQINKFKYLSSISSKLFLSPIKFVPQIHDPNSTLMICVHNISLLYFSSQIFSQPVFAAAERLIAKKLPDNGFVNNTYCIKLPMLPVLKLNLLRLCFRTAYVASTTGIALLFPYFNQVLGVLGALNFWPLAIHFPVEMYIVQRKIRAWSRMWVVLQSIKAVCLLVTIMAFVGSVEGLVSSKLN
ncbi:probable amino acid permease 7 [Actinidia eriantha]|uniref:probable amino acid permease 7 n=1 Tax=Actinidia eriantha TaxID=165200 RepID=UPI00258B1E63|nr:probable amino acid permease 7 [Actinidia eriantha]